MKYRSSAVVYHLQLYSFFFIVPLSWSFHQKKLKSLWCNRKSGSNDWLFLYSKDIVEGKMGILRPGVLLKGEEMQEKRRRWMNSSDSTLMTDSKRLWVCAFFLPGVFSTLNSMKELCLKTIFGERTPNPLNPPQPLSRRDWQCPYNVGT